MGLKYSKLNHSNGMWVIKVEDLKQLMHEAYAQRTTPCERKLWVHKSPCDYGHEIGCILFALEGSPPKGYALYIPEHTKLIVISAWGKATTYKDIVVTGWEQAGKII